MKEVRLATVISHPTQHFVPLYVELAKKHNLKLKVFYIAENGVKAAYDDQFGMKVKWDTPMLEGYDYEFIEPGKIVSDFGFFTVDSKKINSKLRAFNPSWLWVHGYAQRANWRALLSCKHAGVIYTSDSNAWIQPKKDISYFLKQIIKNIGVRLFFKNVDWFLSISPANKQYLMSFGVSESQIVESSFPVDIERLSKQNDAFTAQSKQQLFDELSINKDAKVIVVVGKLIPRKRTADVISAMKKLQNHTVHLVVVGSGECAKSLAEQAKNLNLTEYVHFVGFVNQVDLYAYLALADVFLFPSESEPYGAVVSEALPFSLPIVIARGIGAIGASAIEHKNALLFDMGDIDSLAEQLDNLFSDERMMSSMATASKLMAEQHDKKVMADQLAKICIQGKQ